MLNLTCAKFSIKHIECLSTLFFNEQMLGKFYLGVLKIRMEKFCTMATKSKFHQFSSHGAELQFREGHELADK